MAEQVLYDKQDSIATITLNRPDRMNAMSWSMMQSAASWFQKAEEDDEVKVIVFKGNGPCFSSGWDLDEIPSVLGVERPGHGEGHVHPGQGPAILFDKRVMEFHRAVLYSLKATIAQVQGHCLGAGWSLSSHCDFIIASEEATFGHPEQRMGVTSLMTLTMMAVCCGPKRARELVATGRPWGAKEALELGLINRAVPRSALEEQVAKLAKAICLQPQDGLVVGKAYWRLVLDSLGLGSTFVNFYGSHPQALGIKWEPDEPMLLKAIRDKGITGALSERDLPYPEEYR